MARSFRQPIRLDPGGAAPLLAEDRPDLSLRQVIAISLIPGDCANPFHRREGRPGRGGVYRTAAGQASYIGYIEDRFRELERQGRARLLGRPAVTGPDGSGVLSIRLTYQDMETGTIQPFQSEV